MAVRERQIQLRKIVGKLRGNCGAITKSPTASRCNTSAQGIHRAPTSTQRGQAKAVAGKLWETAKLQKIAKNCGPQSPAPLQRYGLHRQQTNLRAGSGRSDQITHSHTTKLSTRRGPSAGAGRGCTLICTLTGGRT